MQEVTTTIEHYNPFSRFDNALIANIMLRIDYKDMLTLTKVSKFFYNVLRAPGNSFFNNSHFVLTLLRRDINRYFGPFDFDVLYAVDKKNPLTSYTFAEGLCKILEIIRADKTKHIEETHDMLEKYGQTSYEAKFLALQYIRWVYAQKFRPGSFENLFPGLSIAGFFFLKCQNLISLQSLIDLLLLSLKNFGLNSVEPFLQYIISEKTSGTTNITLVSVTNELKTYSDARNSQTKSEKLDSSFKPSKDFMGILLKLVTDEVPEFDPSEDLKGSRAMDLLLYLSHFNMHILFPLMIRYSLINKVLTLKSPEILYKLTLNKYHWIFDLYKENTFDELNALYDVLNYAISYEVNAIESLHDERLKVIAINNQSSLYNAFKSYIKEKIGSVSNHYNKSLASKKEIALKELTFVALSNRVELLVRLLELFNPLTALKIVTKRLSLVQNIIGRYQKYSNLKNLELPVGEIDAFENFETISDKTIEDLLKYIDNIKLENWNKYKSFTKVFILNLHHLASEKNNPNYVRRVLNKFSMHQIESIRNCHELKQIIYRYSHTPLFNKLSASQLMSIPRKTLPILKEIADLELQSQVIDECFKKNDKKPAILNKATVTEIIEKLKNKNAIPKDKMEEADLAKTNSLSTNKNAFFNTTNNNSNEKRKADENKNDTSHKKAKNNNEDDTQGSKSPSRK